MKFLWVNNVPNIVGGTLNCTHSMCQALPEYSHTVVSVQGKFTKETVEAFYGVAKLGDYLESGVSSFDVVVYQNSPNGFVVHPKTVKSVYYQHSDFAGLGRKRCDHVFFVSDYLRREMGETGTVLHQPVTIPKENSNWTKREGFVIGRLCTPTAEKWVKEDFLPHLEVLSNLPAVSFEFVGCPKDLQGVVSGACRGKVIFREAGFSARSLLRCWDVLLYNSSQHETFGRTVREAQRCGCVPVVSNHSGLAEQISHGTSGFLVTSPQDTLHAVRQIMSNPGIASTCKIWGDQHGSLSGWAAKFKEAIGLK